METMTLKRYSFTMIANKSVTAHAGTPVSELNRSSRIFPVSGDAIARLGDDAAGAAYVDAVMAAQRAFADVMSEAMYAC